MKNYEFISFTPTPDEAYFTGLLKCRYYGQEQQYRLCKAKDGKTFLSSFDQRRMKDRAPVYEKGISFIEKEESQAFFMHMMECINDQARKAQQTQKQNPLVYGNATPHNRHSIDEVFPA